MEDSKLKVGILGTGSMAGTMALAIAGMKNAEVCAVASRNMEDACTFALKYDIKKAYGKYEELLKDKEVELVYIASPISHHAFYASECIDKKKAVLLEKPLAVSAEQAEALAAKAEHEGVLLAEAVQTRYMPMADTIREAVKAGRIGKVNTVTASIGYALSSKQRILEPKLAGGALLELGSFPLSFLSLTAGDHVTDITCEARKSKTGLDLEDEVIMVIKDGEDEIRCTFVTSVIGPMECVGMIYGTEGYMKVGDLRNYEFLEIYDADHRLVERIERPAQEESGYVYELEACRKALREGKTECSQFPHRDIVMTMKVMDLIRRGIGVTYPFEEDVSAAAGMAPKQ